MKTCLVLLIGLGLSSNLFSSDPSPAPSPKKDTISGIIKDIQGNPVRNAQVFIYTARVRSGTSVLCPSCYADCRKTATSNKDGQFEIQGVADDLIFKLLVAATGLKPELVADVDPRKPPLSVTLKPHEEGGLDLKGTVLDQEGHPVMGASVTPYSFNTEGSTLHGEPKRDEVALTDDKGEFLLSVINGCKTVGLEVSCRGLATKKFTSVPLDHKSQSFTLDPGVSVTGRLAQDGKPVGDAEIGLIVTDLSSDAYYREMVASTDMEGRFSIPNVPAGREYFIYGLRGTLKDRGVTASKNITTGDPGSSLNAGEIALESGKRVEVQLKLTDGKPVPQGTRVLVSRDDAWDPQVFETDQNGKVGFLARDGEDFKISSRIKGYVMTSDTDLNNNFCVHVTPGVKDAVLAFSPEGSPETLLRARILAPNGEHATNAEAQMTPRYGGMGELNLEKIGIPNKDKNHADPEGYISFPKPNGTNSWIFVSDPVGYALVQSKDFHDSITLIPWARLAGVATWGNEAATNKVVTAEILLPQAAIGTTNQSQPVFLIQNTIHVDPDGSFHEVKIPAGKIWVKFSGKVSPENQPLELAQMQELISAESGKTTNVTLGGKGTLVTGTVEMPTDSDLDLDNTLGNQCYSQRERYHYGFKIHPDGSFQIENVKPGSYVIAFELMRKNPQNPMDAAGTAGESFTVKEGAAALELPLFKLCPPGKVEYAATPPPRITPSGIGVTIQPRKGGKVVISLVLEGGGACKAGLKENDEIIEVNGTNVTAMNIFSVSQLLKGDPETTVKLTVLRDAQSKIDFTVTRHKIDTSAQSAELQAREEAKSAKNLSK